MTTPETVTLHVPHRFTTSGERVFDAWLNPETAGRWLFATPTGTMVRVEIDARVGGTFSIVRREDDDVDHVGVYLEVDRPRRLVFTFAVPKFARATTTVSVDIVPAKAGGCELTLTHEGVLLEWADRTRDGWGKILDGLEAHLG